MSLNTVVEDIRNEARATAEEIRQEAESEADAIIAEAEEAAEAIVAEREREVDRRIEQLREQRISSAQLEAKQEQLAAKRDLLDAVRADVEDRLAALEGERRTEMTDALLRSGLDEFDGSGAMQVYCAPDDRELVESLLEDIDADADADISLAGTRDCLGGVEIESTGSRVRIDNTFDSVLDEIWSETLKDVSDRLFDEG